MSSPGLHPSRTYQVWTSIKWRNSATAEFSDHRSRKRAAAPIRAGCARLIGARKLLEIASTVEPIQDGRIHIEKINGPFLFTHGGSPAEYGAGLALAIAKGWLWRHESGTYVKFTQAGAELFA